MRDLRFFALAGTLALVPLPSPILTVLLGWLLVAQLVGLVAANVRLVGGLQDAVLLFAVLLAAAFWREGNPWPQAEDLGVVGFALGFGGNVLYLKAMLHHQAAHQQMEREAEARLTQHLEAIACDREAGIVTVQRAAEIATEMTWQRDQAVALCALGRQAGGQALLQLACLALALAGSPTPGVFVAWVVGVALPGLANSKVQDLLLSRYVPAESRLC